MEIAKVTSKGQVTIPKGIRDILKLETGSKIIFEEYDGTIRISKADVLEKTKSNIFRDKVLTTKTTSTVINNETISDKIEVMVFIVHQFAERYKLEPDDAEKYLYKYGGMKILDEQYLYIHTLSFDEILDILTDVCKNNGGDIF